MVEVQISEVAVPVLEPAPDAESQRFLGLGAIAAHVLVKVAPKVINYVRRRELEAPDRDVEGEDRYLEGILDELTDAVVAGVTSSRGFASTSEPRNAETDRGWGWLADAAKVAVKHAATAAKVAVKVGEVAASVGIRGIEQDRSPDDQFERTFEDSVRAMLPAFFANPVEAVSGTGAVAAAAGNGSKTW